MRQLLITIAAVVLVGCVNATDYSGKYVVKNFADSKDYYFDLNKNGSIIVTKSARSGSINSSWKFIGNWKVEKEFILMNLQNKNDPESTSLMKFDKDTLKLVSVTDSNGVEQVEKLGAKFLRKVGEENTVLMVNCRACQKEISSEAKVCPHCGQPDPL